MNENLTRNLTYYCKTIKCLYIKECMAMSSLYTSLYLAVRTYLRVGESETHAQNALEDGINGMLKEDGRTETGLERMHNPKLLVLLNTLEALTVVEHHLNKNALKLQNKHYYHMAMRIAVYLSEILTLVGS